MAAVFYLLLLGAMLVGLGIAVASYIVPPAAAWVGSAVRTAAGAAFVIAEYVAGSPGAILLIAAAGIGGAALARRGVRIVSSVAWQRPEDPPASLHPRP